MTTEPSVDPAAELFRTFSTERLIELAKKGHAIPRKNDDGEIIGGSYPIETEADLRNAIRAIGRAAAGERALVVAHVKKRARALGRSDLIPENWTEEPDAELIAFCEELTETFARNWIEQQGGLPRWIRRAADHVMRANPGWTEGRAIATAVNAAKRMCTTGDTNWPGKQQVSAGSQAEACDAVARWDEMRAAAAAAAESPAGSVLFSEAPLGDDPARLEDEEERLGPEFEILRAGSYLKDGRRIEITEADLDRAAANFATDRAAGREVAVDYDHAFATRGDSRAAGWYREIRRRGRSLFARVAWTPPALAALRNGEYRYFSAEFTREDRDQSGKGRGFAIVSGGPTNRPFLRGLGQIAFNEGITFRRAEGRDDNPEQMAEAPPETPETPPETPEGPPEPVETPAPEAPAATVTLSEVEVERLREAARATEGFAQRLARAEEQLRDERFGRVISKAMREGRVDAAPETRERWFARFCRFGEAETVELLNEIPAETVPVGDPAGRPGGERPADAGPEDADPRAWTFHQRAEDLVRAEGIEYEEAVKRLVAEGVRF